MKTVCMVKAPSHLGGDEWYYVGTDDLEEALAMARERGIEGDLDVKLIPNKHGIQPGEFRSAV